MMKFEYLANPYYLQGQYSPTNNIADEINHLTEELKSIDGKGHSGLHEKVHKSFNNIKFRWEQVHESGNLKLLIIDAKKCQNEIADKHFGFVANP